MIQLVVFDLAGTTVYDGDGVADAFCAALATVGVVPPRPSVNEVMGLPKPLAIHRLLVDAGRSPTAAEIEVIHSDFVKRMRDYYATSPAVREIPGASAAFAELRRAGVKIGLNTGFSRPIVEVLLTRLGWTVPATINAVVTSDEVARGRPYPDMVQHLMAAVNIAESSRVAKVGDTSSDLEEGTNAGCRFVIGVTTGAFTREQLEDHPHTHILDSVADVPRLVLGLSKTLVPERG